MFFTLTFVLLSFFSSFTKSLFGVSWGLKTCALFASCFGILSYVDTRPDELLFLFFPLTNTVFGFCQRLFGLRFLLMVLFRWYRALLGLPSDRFSFFSRLFSMLIDLVCLLCPLLSFLAAALFSIAILHSGVGDLLFLYFVVLPVTVFNVVLFGRAAMTILLFFLGYPVSLDSAWDSGVLLYKVLCNWIGWVQYYSTSFFNPVAIRRLSEWLKTTSTLLAFGATVPVEILGHVLELSTPGMPGSRPQFDDYIYFRVRLFLTPIAFSLGLGGFIFLIPLVVFCFCTAFCFLFLDFSFFWFAGVWLFQFAKVLAPCKVAWLAPHISLQSKIWALELCLYSRSYSHRQYTFAKGVVHIPTLVDGTLQDVPTPYVVDIRTDISRLHPVIINKVFSQAFAVWSPAFQAALLLGFLLFLSYRFIKLVIFPFRVAPTMMKALLRLLCGFLAVAALWVVPSFWFDYIFASVIRAYLSKKFIFDMWISEMHKVCRMTGLSLMYGVSYVSAFDENGVNKLSHLDTAKISSLFKVGWLGLSRRILLRLVITLDDFRLPEFIQAQYKSPTPDTIRESYKILQDLGFPIDDSFIDSIQDPGSSSYLREWGDLRQQLLGTSNFSLGFNNLGLAIRPWFQTLQSWRSFFPEVAGYIHSSSFTGVKEEISSTSRYWTGSHLDSMSDTLFEDVVEATYEAVRPQYAHSRLSSPEFLYKQWIKRYNMGFGFGVRGRFNRLKQLTRAATIQTMGGKHSFIAAWKKVFAFGGKILIPAPVFTKFETLSHRRLP